MMPSLFSAVSGLRNHQTRMDVIGDNIANVNTIGFKASRVSFATGFSQLLQAADAPSSGLGGSNGMEVGLGSRISSIDRLFSQGNFENTGNRTDLAIQGDGFFVVGDGSRQYFTRAGNFQLDADGSLLAAGGRYHVMGHTADKNGVLSGTSAVESLKLPFGEKDPALATTKIKYFCNLNADASTARVHTASIAFTDGGNPASSATLLNDLDQVTAALDDGDVIHVTGQSPTGQAVDVAFTYGTSHDGTTLGDLITKANSASGFDSASATGCTLSADASGKLVLRDNQDGTSTSSVALGFTDQGTASAMVLPTFMTTEEGTTGTHSASINVYDSRGDTHKVQINFTQDVTQSNAWNWQIVVDDGAINAANGNLAGNSGTLRFNNDGSLMALEGGPLTFTPANAQGMVVNLNGGTVGTFDGITQFASPSTTIALNQDGHGMGVLQDFAVDNSGIITGSYSNGVSRTLGQIAVARFANPSGLRLEGENIYGATANSGDVMIGLEAGKVNQLYSGYLELSNVDLSQEFTDMIIAQRGFQASARVITVDDQLLNEVTQLKR
jgi:flagellar hook protein FlgE